VLLAGSVPNYPIATKLVWWVLVAEDIRDKILDFV
jgi:hypothetical protein